MDLARPVLAAHMIAMHFNSDGLHLKCAKREGAGDDDSKLDVFCTMVTILICAIGQEFFLGRYHFFTTFPSQTHQSCIFQRRW